MASKHTYEKDKNGGQCPPYGLERGNDKNGGQCPPYGLERGNDNNVKRYYIGDAVFVDAVPPPPPLITVILYE